MANEDIKVVKSENFALRIVKLYQHLSRTKQEVVLSKQLLRAGTSIGANIAESLCAESRDDFIHKLSISQKEASESRYWIRLLFRAGYLTDREFESLDSDCRELLNILSAIIVKCKQS